MSVDLKKLKKAIELQKELIINELIEKSNEGEKLDDKELKMLENYYEDAKER